MPTKTDWLAGLALAVLVLLLLWGF